MIMVFFPSARYVYSCVCLFIAILLAWAAYAQEASVEPNIKKIGFDTTTIQLHSKDKTHWLRVDLALRPEQWERGLMYRKVMPRDTGMLFIFPDMQMRSFWMKNTFIPLDIIFLDHQGRILHIHENAEILSQKNILSKYPAKMVLEINAGLSKTLGIDVGDRVYHPAFAKIANP